MTIFPMTLDQTFEHNSVSLCALQGSQYYESYRKYQICSPSYYLLYQRNKANT